MKRGWYGESKRHGLAAKGIKTTTDKPIHNAMTKMTTPQLQTLAQNSQAKNQRDKKISEYRKRIEEIVKARDSGRITTEQMKALAEKARYEILEGKEKVDVTNNTIRERQFSPEQCSKDSYRTKKLNDETSLVLCKKKGSDKQSVQSIIKKREELKDSDGDGMPDVLDCDPKDPTKQGYFDGIKKKISMSLKSDTNPEKIAYLRAKVEEKEEMLEKKKEALLLKQKDKLLDERQKLERDEALAEIRAREKEVDRIQAELEKGSFKNELKANIKSLTMEGAILAKKAIKKTKVKLTKKEKASSDVEKIKKESLKKKYDEEKDAKERLAEIKKRKEEINKLLKKLP